MRLTVRNLVAKSKIARLNYVYEPSSTLAAMATLKVEVNLNEGKPLYELTTVHIDVPQEDGSLLKVPVVSYDLDEMLGTKMRALIQRDHGRDLYDLWRALQTITAPSAPHTVNPGRVGEAFRYYLKQEGTTCSQDAIGAIVGRRMQSRKFLGDMSGYLPQGGTYDPKQAYQVFCDVLLPHL